MINNSEMNNSDKMLFSYYDQSFLMHLGINFPYYDNNGISGHIDLKSYITNSFPDKFADDIFDKLNHYKTIIAPIKKTSNLLYFLSTRPNKISKIMDFGCGDGHIVDFLIKNINSVNEVIGVDKDSEIFCRKQHQHKQIARVIYCTEIPSYLKEEINKVDLIVFISTLHHIDREEQNSIFEIAVSSLRVGGYIYIYEDSWDDMICVNNNGLSKLDMYFSKLSDFEKINIYLSNEYWSNLWCYGRNLPAQHDNYRSLDGWKIFTEKHGIQIIESGCNGFDFERLHGVPSSWLIGQKI